MSGYSCYTPLKSTRNMKGKRKVDAMPRTKSKSHALTLWWQNLQQTPLSTAYLHKQLCFPTYWSHHPACFRLQSVNLNTDHPKIKSFSGSLYILICVNCQNSSFFKATAIWVVQLSACCKAFDSFEDFGKLNNLFNMHCCHTVLKQVGCW